MSLREINELEVGIIRSLQGGRLDRVDDFTLCWAPHNYGSLALYKNGAWAVITPTEPVYFYNTDRDYYGSTLSSDLNYDVFARYFNSSTFKLELLPWSSDTERADPLESLDGIWTFGGMRYLGSVRLISGPIFVDSSRYRFVVNLDNKKSNYVSASVWGSTNIRFQSTSWTEFTSLSRGEFLCIDPSVSVDGAAALARVASNNGNILQDLGLALNVTDGIIGTSNCEYTYGYSDSYTKEAFGYGSPRLGWNWITILLKTSNASYYNEYHSWGGEIGKALLYIEV
jgi:hypothetical protein